MSKKKDSPAERDHLAMMKDPYRWPNLSLPLKRRSRTEHKVWDCAVLVADFNNPPNYTVLYGANIWNPESIRKATPEATTPEKLVADGWKVD